MPACPFREQIALYERDGGRFTIDPLTPGEVGHYCGRLEALKREHGDAFGGDEYGTARELQPTACDFDPASRAVRAAGVERSFASGKLLTVLRRSGNVGI